MIMEANDIKQVYILISKTSTMPSYFIKKWTKEPYAHTSLALDIELREMYSFARKGMYNPFNCGFISEDIESGIFGRDVNTRCVVFELSVTREQYDRILEELNKFKSYPERYKYNYWGIFGVVRNKAVEREYNYFCSQFVATVLKRAGVDILDKEPGLIRPEDFRKCKKLKVIYKGLLTNYREYLQKYRSHVDEIASAEQ
ncbi:MAG: hypothetical protein ACI4EF_11545 [Coprococcus sp.]